MPRTSAAASPSSSDAARSVAEPARDAAGSAMRRLVFTILGSLLALLAFGQVSAHESQPGLLELKPVNANRYEVLWRAPIYYNQPHPASVQFPDMPSAASAVRGISQAALFPSNCRLLDPGEALMNGSGDGRSALLVLGFESLQLPPGAAIAIRSEEGALLAGPFTAADLAELNPSFVMHGQQGGFDAVALQRYPELEEIRHVHTAGNSSGIVDGAAAVLVGSREAGKKMGLKPRARIKAFASIGSERTIMLTGPAPASLKKTWFAFLILFTQQKKRGRAWVWG